MSYENDEDVEPTTFRVLGVVSAGYHEDIEADTPEEAAQNAYASVCHQCAGHLSLGDLDGISVEDEAGNVLLSEPSFHETQLDNARRFRASAEALWKLLDDISTLDDVCREDDAAFRNAVRKVQQERGQYAESHDGHTLVWTHGVTVPT
jgi:hypothetical protein